MRELILLYTKVVDFTFSSETFTKIDRVAMRSPYTPILASTFMVELEISSILKDHLSCWRQYIDNTIHLFKMDWLNIYCQHSITSIVPLNQLLKQKVVNKLSFLDTLLIRTGDNIERLVYLEN